MVYRHIVDIQNTSMKPKNDYDPKLNVTNYYL